MSKLTSNQLLALGYLKSKSPGFVSPTEVGKEVGIKLGKQGKHSSFGSPLCKKLVATGFAERDDTGHYKAVVKIVSRSELSTSRMIGGNEKQFTSVIMDGKVNHWVGFGWVDEGEPNEDQKLTLPIVSND